MRKNLRIGTRDSALAMWQAHLVAEEIEKSGFKTELVAVKSPGDKDLQTPLHQFGSTGIFTKILDDALLRRDVDLAVHSLKDYPTQGLPEITLPAVLARGPHEDILVYNKAPEDWQAGEEIMIATGSIRRIAQWKHRYPHHQTTGLRGNVQTRLKKLRQENWHGAIFARAGLQRVKLLPQNHRILDWMLPAPAQGCVAATCLKDDEPTVQVLRKINHRNSDICAQAERLVLNRVEGGCSAPVGALAKISAGKLFLSAAVLSLDGTEKIEAQAQGSSDKWQSIAEKVANSLLDQGASRIMATLRNND